MDLKEFQKEAGRTLAPLSNKMENNLHMMLGLTTEVGELADIHKREFAYGKDADMINAAEEVGDILWYLANYATINNIDLYEVMDRVINKLKVRYPEKFNQTDAIDRDLDAERKALEG